MTLFRDGHGAADPGSGGSLNGSHGHDKLSLVGFGILLALWPILIVHAAFAISVVEGYVPLCNPYWDGCTSISRAGRHGWANHLFRGTLLPYTVLLAFYWWLNQRWLIALGSRGSTAMLVSGWIGALFMILYVTFLGTEGSSYQLMRRYGINVYFGGTFLAQVLLALRIRSLQAEGSGPSPAWVAPGLAVLAGSVLAIGLFYVGARLGLAADQDRWENALEWVSALGMQLSIALTVLGWRGSRLTLRIDRAGVAGRDAPATGKVSRRRGEP
jgi:hypothetical protein